MRMEKITLDELVKYCHSRENGNPEYFRYPKRLDSCFRRNDKKTSFRVFSEIIIFKITLTSFLAGIFLTTGIGLMRPKLSFGQPQKKTVVSQEIRKDPFSIPPGVRLLSKEIPGKEEKTIQPIVGVKAIEIKPVEPTLHLKAILISDHIRLASIDRSIVTVGDLINGEKVLEIRPDRVILEKEGKKRTILLDQSPVKITVEGK